MEGSARLQVRKPLAQAHSGFCPSQEELDRPVFLAFGKVGADIGANLKRSSRASSPTPSTYLCGEIVSVQEGRWGCFVKRLPSQERFQYMDPPKTLGSFSSFQSFTQHSWSVHLSDGAQGLLMEPIG